MAKIEIGTQEWLDQVQEDIIEPELPIIDPHHHLFDFPTLVYLAEDLKADTGSGHNIVKTIYMECSSKYREDGPEELKSLGETEFVVAQAKKTRETGGAYIDAMVGHVDLTLAEAARDILEQHSEISQGMFKGVRHALSWPEHPEVLLIPGRSPKDLYLDENFRKGVKLLGSMGLTYDSWHYHYQNREFAALARAVPDTQMVLDHFGTPLGVGPYAAQKKEIFEQWKKDIREIAKCDNVVAKVGGMAMPDNGYGWNLRDKPATSDEFVAAQRDHYLHVIDCFGPERCMMESNFPVDRMSISYPVLFNGLKKMVADFSDSEKTQMFQGTAAQIYKLKG